MNDRLTLARKSRSVLGASFRCKVWAVQTATIAPGRWITPCSSTTCECATRTLRSTMPITEQRVIVILASHGKSRGSPWCARKRVRRQSLRSVFYIEIAAAAWRETMPCHAMPCHPMPCHNIQCHAMPCHNIQCHAKPRHATPRHATPRHATPRHAMPCHAMPCRAIIYNAITYHTIPHSTIPYHPIARSILAASMSRATPLPLTVITHRLIA